MENLFKPHIDKIKKYMESRDLGYAKLGDDYLMLFDSQNAVIGRFDIIGDQVMNCHLSKYNTADRLMNLADFTNILEEIIFSKVEGRCEKKI